MTETITVANIELPAAGRKQGTITDSSGNRWKAWADKLADYRVGSTYTITVSSVALCPLTIQVR